MEPDSSFATFQESGVTTKLDDKNVEKMLNSKMDKAIKQMDD